MVSFKLLFSPLPNACVSFADLISSLPRSMNCTRLAIRPTAVRASLAVILQDSKFHVNNDEDT